MFVLWWKNEEIDEVETREEAEYLQGEYTLAYGGTVTIREVSS